MAFVQWMKELYFANDYNEDGIINDQEFQDTMSGFIDDLSDPVGCQEFLGNYNNGTKEQAIRSGELQ